MVTFIRSLVTATLIAGTVMLFTIRVVAPLVPPFVGPPDIREARNLKLPSANELRLENVDGAVSVRAHPDANNTEVEIRADIKVYLSERTDEESLKGYLDSLVEARSDGEVLRIVTEPGPRPAPVDLMVDYVILVPQGMHIDVAGSNGNVWISKGCGQVAVHGGNADVEIVEPRGTVVAENTNGRIKVVDARDDATLRSANGNIYAYMLDGTLDAETTNGHIVARVLSDQVESFDLSSLNGGITVVMAKGTSGALDATTSRGIIRTDFPIDGGDEGVLRQKQVKGNIGEGHTRLTVETLNGNIWFARQ